ncbi:hypothetical protein NVP1031O_154 [Vibrio phage 1.031.O._10N.261.46.F8]|nr:hypothetical protein NVP1031O_154 [Vibrio phage 1.031.O._10N.261.46.F8]
MSTIQQDHITEKSKKISISESSPGSFRKRDVSSVLICNRADTAAVASLYLSVTADGDPGIINTLVYKHIIDAEDTWYWTATDGLRLPAGYSLFLELDESSTSEDVVTTVILE